MLGLDEKLEVLKTAQGVAGEQAGADDGQRGRRRASGAALAKRAAAAKAPTG